MADAATKRKAIETAAFAANAKVQTQIESARKAKEQAHVAHGTKTRTDLNKAQVTVEASRRTAVTNHQKDLLTKGSPKEAPPSRSVSWDNGHCLEPNAEIAPDKEDFKMTVENTQGAARPTTKAECEKLCLARKDATHCQFRINSHSCKSFNAGSPLGLKPTTQDLYEFSLGSNRSAEKGDVTLSHLQSECGTIKNPLTKATSNEAPPTEDLSWIKGKCVDPDELAARNLKETGVLGGKKVDKMECEKLCKGKTGATYCQHEKDTEKANTGECRFFGKNKDGKKDKTLEGKDAVKDLKGKIGEERRSGLEKYKVNNDSYIEICAPITREGQ